MESQLRTEFLRENIRVDDAAVITKCAHLGRTFGLSPSDVVAKWLAFALRERVSADTPTLQHVDDLWHDVEKSTKGSIKQQAFSEGTVYNKSNIAGVFTDDFLSAFGVEGEVAEELKNDLKKEQAMQKISGRKRHNFTSPTSNKTRSYGDSILSSPPPTSTPDSLAATPASAGKDYSTRTNAGQVESTFNPQNRSTVPPKNQRMEVQVGIFPNSVEQPYRYMFEKLLDRADILDGRIDEMGVKMIKKNKLLEKPEAKAPKEGEAKEGEEMQPDAEPSLAHVGLPTQDSVTVVGRICLDTAADGKLNPKSIVLEGSKETSNGTRVYLDVSDVPAYSLFPGQIIAAQGTNPTGHTFSASVIYDGAAPPYKKSTPRDLINHYFSNDNSENQAIDIIVAAGPFTSTTDLSYEPLDDLLDVVRREKPNVVILLGPFVDESHPMIRAGEVEVTFEELYESIIHKITSVVQEELQRTHLILVPSLKDVTHDKVFPQPPFPKVEGDRVWVFANPCTIMIQEVTIGICSTDILFDMSKTETSAGPNPDRMGRLVNHLFEQRCYYPLHPPAQGVNFESAHIDETLLPVCPDVMILPSDLRAFAKSVKNSLVVNPGRLTKFSSGGTYARTIIYAPRRMDIPEGEKSIAHGVPDRSVVQIVKI